MPTTRQLHDEARAYYALCAEAEALGISTSLDDARSAKTVDELRAEVEAVNEARRVHELRVTRANDVLVDGEKIGYVAVVRNEWNVKRVEAVDNAGRAHVTNATSRDTAAFILARRTGALKPGQRFINAGVIAGPRPGNVYTVAAS